MLQVGPGLAGDTYRVHICKGARPEPTARRDRQKGLYLYYVSDSLCCLYSSFFYIFSSSLLFIPYLGTSQKGRGKTPPPPASNHHREAHNTAIRVGANRSVAAAPLSICGPATNLGVGDFPCGGVTNS